MHPPQRIYSHIMLSTPACLGRADGGMALAFPSSHSTSPFPRSSSSSPYLPPPCFSSFSVYLSRWNNAKPEPFNRCPRRLSPALSVLPPSTSSTPDRTDSNKNHPAFRRVRPRPLLPPVSAPDSEDAIRVSEKGVTYRLKDAPFEFQYSYTETPKIKPLALREPPFLPFGPKETPRPWTGRAPLPPSKKKIPEFDSFKLPPPGKKGVKPIQAPGPYLPGSDGPRYKAASGEEILGEPLTKEEVVELIKGCLKSRRQLNMGRDGFTHNMLDIIHAHWKRRRVCKIKCKGVCTVDLDNVCQQLEVKTGGKIIHRKGGVIFLFRGRNYNYRTRPRYPLMLWRPVSPVYPRLVKRVPDGLTLEEATDMRKRGRDLPPICKLGKNGVYVNLVKQVKEAFEACELVRVNCRGMNRSDYKKIGAKLQDLVPCVLLSFEFEHILMWRGTDCKSSRPSLDTDGSDQVTSSSANSSLLVNDELKSDTCSDAISSMVDEDVITKMPLESSAKSAEDVITKMAVEGLAESAEDAQSFSVANANEGPSTKTDIEPRTEENKGATEGPSTKTEIEPKTAESEGANEGPSTKTEIEPKTEESKGLQTEMSHLNGVKVLLDQAIQSGIAASLSELEYPDADVVYQRSVELAKKARPGPIFQVNVRKKDNKGDNREKHAMLKSVEEGEEEKTLLFISERSSSDIKKDSSNRRKKKDELLELLPSVVPHGSLRVDELAKLLC